MTDKDIYKRGEYGFVPLSDFVDRFMAHSFNNGRKYYKNMLLIAADTWKELYWKTLRVTRTKRVCVDHATHTVRIPTDCLKVIEVRIFDVCDNMQELTYNPRRQPKALAAKGCGCKKCDCTSSVCESMGTVAHLSEDIEFSGVIYQKLTKSKVCPNGDLVMEITEPFAKKDENGGVQVVFRTYQNRVGSLAVKPCGCVENTVENNRVCCSALGTPISCCAPTCKTGEGQYKIDGCYIHFFDISCDYVDINYITNGEECMSEIMIPEYCREAMFAGLYLFSIRFRQTISPYEKRAAKTEWAMEKQELYEFLNPISAHDFNELQHQFPKW
jgi:hypothetical protein